MRLLAIAALSVLPLVVSGCATSPVDYCGKNPGVCVAGAAVIAGGILLATREDEEAAPPAPSDRRLKQDIEKIGTLPNGLPIYTFRYVGDDRVFTGVMAQDALASPRWRHAVSVAADGFYRVDYSALGLQLYNADAINDAAGHALAIVTQ